MNPGRELDALIAEKVMGYYVFRDTLDTDGHPCYVAYNHEYKSRFINKYYSTDMSAAWEVVEKLIKDGFSDFDMGTDGQTWSVWWCSNKAPGNRTRADTAPHAICLAALKAVGEK